MSEETAVNNTQANAEVNTANVDVDVNTVAQDVAKSEVAEGAEANAQAMFDQEQDGLTANDGELTNASGEVMLISDPDDSNKLDTLTGADLEMSEEDIIKAMTAGDTIRNSQTVPTGKYIITMSKIRLDKDVKFVFTADNDGNPKPVREKNIGLRYNILYNLDDKSMMEDNGYQMYHLAKKDGTPWEGGRTDYKRICANAISAALNDPAKTMDAILKYLDDNKLAPAVAYNEYAASTDDNKRYFIANIKEIPASDGYQAGNELVIGSLKDDGGYYNTLLDTES